MHRILVIALTLFSCGCGAETVGSAATGAAAKAQEAKQAQQNMERIRQKLDAATQAGQERAAETGKSMDY